MRMEEGRREQEGLERKREEDGDGIGEGEEESRGFSPGLGGRLKSIATVLVLDRICDLMQFIAVSP